jgi:hypothetical protein
MSRDGRYVSKSQGKIIAPALSSYPASLQVMTVRRMPMDGPTAGSKAGVEANNIKDFAAWSANQIHILKVKHEQLFIYI